MDRNLQTKILDILANTKDLTIATMREDGFPQATVVSYVNDGMTIYFGCGGHSQKAANIARNNKVSITATPAYRDWDEIQGVSMGGIAERVTDAEEMARVYELMVAKFPQVLKYGSPEDISGMIVVRVTPKVVSVLDYTKGFGHMDLVTVP